MSAPDSPLHPPKTLAGYWLARPRLVVFITACTAGTVGLNLWTPFLVRDALDAMVDGSATASMITRLALLFLAAAFTAALLSRGMRGIATALSHHVVRDICADAMRNLSRLDASFYRREHTGDIMNRLNTDVRAVGELAGQGFVNTIRALFAFSASLVVMFHQNHRLAVVMSLLLPTMTGIVFCFILLLRKRYEAVQAQTDRVSSFSQENFTGVRVVKGFGIEDRQNGIFRDLNREGVRRSLAYNRIEAPVWPLISFLFGLSSMLILWMGGKQVIAGTLSLGTLVQFLQYLVFLQWPLLAFGWSLSLFIRGAASWKRLGGVLQGASAIQDPRNPSALPASGEVAFEDVSLVRGEARVLDRVSLVIPEGRIIGITGPTGCGKTSLVSLLVRLCDPDEGRVTVGGCDVRSVSLAELRDAIRMAPQEPFLFSDTVRANLLSGAPDATPETLAQALQTVGLHDEVARMPDGSDTMLGERGVTLSGGQRQRLSLARALVGNPRILVLDDSFSAVDTQTEKNILDGLMSRIRGRTTLLVSHRVSTLRYADSIVVIERGRITQSGPHDDLCSQPGYYRELDTAQRLQARLESMP